VVDKIDNMSFSQEHSFSIRTEGRVDAAKSALRVLLVTPCQSTEISELKQTGLLAESLNNTQSVKCSCKFERTHVNSGISGVLLRFSFFSSIITHLDYLKSLIKAIPGYDIIHIFHFSEVSFFGYTAPAILLCRFFGKKIILSYKNYQTETDFENKQRYYAPLLRLCNRIVVTSDYLKYLLAGYDFEADVVRDSVRLSDVESKTVTTLQPKILMVSSLKRHSRVEVAIKAFKLVKQKYPRAEMTVVGDGPRRIFFENVVKNQNVYGITFVGWQDWQNLVEHYKQSDVYINTAWTDTVPMTLLEAMAAGLPVITADTGGTGEIVKDRVNGILTRVNDHDALADRILELIETPELTGQLSLQAQKTFKVSKAEKIKVRWLELYRQILD